jgi:aminobenzoyl-glutamate utilization protein B
MLQAGKVLAATGLDLVLDPELVKKAQAELKDRLQGETYVAIPKGVKPRGLSGAKN